MANFEMFPPIITPYGVFSGGPFGLKVYEAQKKIIQEPRGGPGRLPAVRPLRSISFSPLTCAERSRSTI
jgi:hypothetical protein